jgi:glycosyltransferase involved in cell wall biosynthesis
MLESASLLKKRFKDFRILLPGHEKLLEKQIMKLHRYIERRAKELGIAENLLFYPGTLPDSDLPSLYSACDFVVNPSMMGEPFGLQFIEAGACRKPVIGTRGGGVPEIVKNGYNGFLVEIGNRKKLMEAMYDLISDGKVRARMGENNHKIVMEKFSIEKQVPKILKVYKRLLKHK